MGSGQGCGWKIRKPQEGLQTCGYAGVMAQGEPLRFLGANGSEDVVAAWAGSEKQQEPGRLQILQRWDAFEETVVAGGGELELLGHVLGGTNWGA